MKPSLLKFLQDYFALEIVPNQKIRIPYWRNRFLKSGRRIRGPLEGKGTPSQIKKETVKIAKKKKVDLQSLSEQQIYAFMQKNKIGLDCSGFAFQILNFLKPGFYQNKTKAAGRSLNPIRRFNAEALCSEQNTEPIVSVADIKVGDLIPLSFLGQKIDHCLVVVEKNEKEIVYAHSSSQTKPSGPHLGKIKITESQGSIADQYWQEEDKKGIILSNYLILKNKKLNARRII